MRTDLIAPVQWWYFDNPALPRMAMQAEAEVAEAMLLIDGARLGGRYANSLLALFFLRVKYEEDDTPYPIPVPAWVAYVPYHTSWAPHCTFDPILTSQPLDEHELREAQGLMTFVVSSICWLRSTVPQRERRTVSRGTRRRLGLTANQPTATIQVITLRAIDAMTAERTPREVAWSCRWSVRSHWRRHAVTDGHRLTLIPSYIKGPEGKPFRPPGALRYKIDR